MKQIIEQDEETVHFRVEDGQISDTCSGALSVPA